KHLAQICGLGFQMHGKRDLLSRKGLRPAEFLLQRTKQVAVSLHPFNFLFAGFGQIDVSDFAAHFYLFLRRRQAAFNSKKLDVSPIPPLFSADRRQLFSRIFIIVMVVCPVITVFVVPMVAKKRTDCKGSFSSGYPFPYFFTRSARSAH